MMSMILVAVLAATLPTFETFRRVDRERRESGKWETAETTVLTQVDPKAVVALAEQHPDDAMLQWGAAELLRDWPRRETRFAAALAASGTNTAMALRFGCAAAQTGHNELALAWLHYCHPRDPSNAVPWLVGWSLLQQKDPPPATWHPPAGATVYNDCGADAARARIRVLEALGYTPYAARRIGYAVDMPVLPMIRDLCREPAADRRDWLLRVARSMQQGTTFLVTELVGQSAQNGLLAQAGALATAGPVADRVAELKVRRESLTELTRDVGQTVIDTATEAELVRYFDEMLTLGEEAALHRLARTVRGGR